jgi:hypothetical protein
MQPLQALALPGRWHSTASRPTMHAPECPQLLKQWCHTTAWVHLLFHHTSTTSPPPPPLTLIRTHHPGGLCQGNALKESLRRYERLWLPLIAQQQAEAGGPHGYSQVVPPLDVALLWHLHRLQPEAYAAGERGTEARMLVLTLSCRERRDVGELSYGLTLKARDRHVTVTCLSHALAKYCSSTALRRACDDATQCYVHETCM